MDFSQLSCRWRPKTFVRDELYAIIRNAVEDSYKRLILPLLTRSYRYFWAVFTTVTTVWNVPTTASVEPQFLPASHCVLSAGPNWRVQQRKSPSPCLCGTCDSACWCVRSGGVSSWGWTPDLNTAVNWLFYPQPVSDNSGHFCVGLIVNATETKWVWKLFELWPYSAKQKIRGTRS